MPVLTPTQIAKAVTANQKSMTSLGWINHFDALLPVLGYTDMCPTEAVFAQGVADWQAKNPPLTPDGIVGPKTWTKLSAAVAKATGKPVPPPPPPPVPPPATGAPWVTYALAEMTRWDTEIATWGKDKSAKNAEDYVDWDTEYFKASPYYGGKFHPDGTMPNKYLHWCAAFVNWCLHRSGYSHSGSAGAGSFRSASRWRFDALTAPKQGCVLVTGDDSHVTFLYDWSGLPTNPNGDVAVSGGVSVKTLGGNQSNRVRVSGEKRTLRSAKGRNGVTSPYLWPLRGESACTIATVDTDAAHFCGHHA